MNNNANINIILSIITVFLIAIAIVCVLLIVDQKLSESSETTVDIEVTEVVHQYDSGFKAYDRTIVFTSNNSYILYGIQVIPTGNISLTLRTDTNCMKSHYRLVSWEKIE